jgi:hypothetical protein
MVYNDTLGNVSQMDSTILHMARIDEIMQWTHTTKLGCISGFRHNFGAGRRSCLEMHGLCLGYIAVSIVGGLCISLIPVTAINNMSQKRHYPMYWVKNNLAAYLQYIFSGYSMRKREEKGSARRR